MFSIETLFAAALTVFTAAGFIFLWHKWNVTRSTLVLVLAIAVTALMAVSIAFSLATLILYIISL